MENKCRDSETRPPGELGVSKSMHDFPLEVKLVNLPHLVSEFFAVICIIVVLAGCTVRELKRFTAAMCEWNVVLVCLRVECGTRGMWNWCVDVAVRWKELSWPSLFVNISWLTTITVWTE